MRRYARVDDIAIAPRIKDQTAFMGQGHSLVFQAGFVMKKLGVLAHRFSSKQIEATLDAFQLVHMVEVRSRQINLCFMAADKQMNALG